MRNGYEYPPLGATELYERFMRLALLSIGARSRWLDYPGGRLHALDLDGKGELPPIVLLHGFSASGASQYWSMAPYLRERARRVILPDLPGHGLSTVPHGLDAQRILDGLHRAMDSLLDRPVVMFASSMAGAFAVRFAHQRPESLSGLMLCSPAGAPMSATERLLLQESFRIENHRDALEFVDRLFHKPHPFRHIYAWGIRRQFNRPHLLDLLDRLDEDQFLQPEELRGLKMPVYLLWGGADRVLPTSHLAFYREHLPPGTQIETPPTLGHAPFLSLADGVADRLVRFANRITGSTR